MPRNGLALVSLFSGCGGSCLGFRMAGFTTVYASEFVAAAREVYALNFPDVKIDDRDVRALSGGDVLDHLALRRGELDAIEGSPPCASFSTSGKRHKGWGQKAAYSRDKWQRSDDLFFEFARLLDEIAPRAFVAENVSGLVKGRAKGYFLLILDALKRAAGFPFGGYRVEARLLDAARLGVPQHRQRLIFVGVREDLTKNATHNAPYTFPEPLPYAYSVADALEGLSDPIAVKRGGSPDNWHGPHRPAPTLTQTDGTVSPTAYLSGGGFVRTESEQRKFTIDELKRLCGFPDDFRLAGDFAQRWERLARAVPPPMMRAVAEPLADTLLRRVDGIDANT